MNVHRAIALSLVVGGLMWVGFGAKPAPKAASRPAATLIAPPPEQKERLAEAFGRLPLTFEENRGQVDAQVRYLCRGSGYTLFLTDTEAVLSLRKASAENAIVRMSLPGARPAKEVCGSDPQPGKSHYFIGNDPAQWQADVGHYGRVSCAEVYDGIDLVYYGNQRQLEFDFVVAPGADPSAIRMAYAGTERLEIAADGALLLHVDGGVLRQHAPVVYQEHGGTRERVAGEYRLTRENEVAFALGAYDASRTLVIDPVLAYSTYLGGSGDDTASSIAVDGSGAAYITGITASTNFPMTGAFQGTYGGGTFDVFVTKINAAGSARVYSTYLGGSLEDRGMSIAVDGSGNAYIGGWTQSLNFPVANAFQATFNGNGAEGFITKLSPNGSTLVYSTYFGGSVYDAINGIAVDSGGNVHVCGYTLSTNLPVANAQIGTLQGVGDGFAAKFTANGSALTFSTYLGGINDDAASCIALDANGNVYVGGYAESGFPLLNAGQNLYGGGPLDGFVVKMTSNGQSTFYSTYLGGLGEDQIRGIVPEATGAVHVTGFTYSANFPVLNAYQDSLFGAPDAFVTKINANGNGLVYSTYLGGTNVDGAYAIALDGGGNVYVTGETSSTDFPNDGALPGGSGVDAFVTKLDPTGLPWYSSLFGGTGTDVGNGIALDGNGLAYVAGRTQSTNFPTQSPFQANNAGAFDTFVAKLATPPVIDSPNSASGTVGQPFQYLITATENPTSFGATALPAGFSIDTSTGQISGTPTATGVTNVTISATNASGSDSITLQISIVNPAPSISSLSPSSTVVGSAAFTLTVNGTGFVSGSTVRWKGSDRTTTFVSHTQLTASIPASDIATEGSAGVTVLNGTPGGGESSAVNFAVTAPPPVVNSPSSVSGNVGAAFNYTITATNSPTNFNASGLPPGLSVSASTGAITGTPSAEGVSDVTISASNSGGTGNATLRITIGKANNAPFVRSVAATINGLLVIQGVTGKPVTFSADATDADGNALTFAWDFKNGPVKTGNPVQHTFTAEGVFDSTVSVNDGIATVVYPFQFETFAPASGGSGVVNISDGKGQFSNPLNGITVGVASSDGGVIGLKIEIDALNRAEFDVDTDYDGINGRLATRTGTAPVQKFSTSALVVATAKAKDKGTTTERGKARKMLAVGGRETGQAGTEGFALNEPANRTINVSSLKAKFSFNSAKADSLALKASFELPEGLDLAKPQTLEFGIGNVLDKTTIGAKGKAPPGQAGRIKKISVKWPKLPKGTTVTPKGTSATVTLTYTVPDLDNLGFDTEGVSAKARDLDTKFTAQRKIQTQLLLAGVSYEATIDATFKTSKPKTIGGDPDSGSLQRTQR